MCLPLAAAGPCRERLRANFKRFMFWKPSCTREVLWGPKRVVWLIASDGRWRSPAHKLFLTHANCTISPAETREREKKINLKSCEKVARNSSFNLISVWRMKSAFLTLPVQHLAACACRSECSNLKIQTNHRIGFEFGGPIRFRERERERILIGFSGRKKRQIEHRNSVTRQLYWLGMKVCQEYYSQIWFVLILGSLFNQDLASQIHKVRHKAIPAIAMRFFESSGIWLSKFSKNQWLRLTQSDF